MKKIKNIILILSLIAAEICYSGDLVNDNSNNPESTMTVQGWYQIPSPTINTLNGLYSSPYGLITYGNAGSFYQKDGGAITWTNKSIPAAFNIKGLASVYFAVGPGGKVYRSTNGGTSWLQFLSTSNPVSNPTFNINSVWTADAGHLYIVGNGGNFAYAQNVGLSYMDWVHISTGTVQRLNSMAGGFVENSKGVIIAVGDNGTILKSIYPYSSWTIEPSGTTSNLYCIVETNNAQGSQFAIAAGANGTILRSTDKGNTWTQSVSNTANDLYCVSYVAGIGLACGANGTILNDNFGYTNNRAVNWVTQSTPTTATLYGISGFYGYEAYAVGSGGIILRTTTSGTPIKLSLTALIQGFYNNVTNKMIKDTVKVYEKNTSSPYATVDSSKSILDSSGKGSFFFNKIAVGSSYYIEVKHRNSIETWSAAGVGISPDSVSYNFTGSSATAYGNNLIQVDNSPLRFGIYSGDVNQNGSIDAADLSLVDNDAFNFVSGYVNTDVTGDNVVDAADLGIIDNNAFNFVSKITPP